MPELFLALSEGDLDEGWSSWPYDLTAFVRVCGGLYPEGFAGNSLGGEFAVAALRMAASPVTVAAPNERP